MARLDFSEASKNKITYLILILVVVIILIYSHNARLRETEGRRIKNRKPVDGNGEAYYYGRGSDKDSVSELLDRIDWSTYLEKRTSYWYRLFRTVLIVTIIVMVFVWKKIPHPATAILLFLVIFIPLYAIKQFDYVHGDVYNDYYIKKNVELLRQKLGLKSRGHHPPEPVKEVPNRTTATSPL